MLGGLSNWSRTVETLAADDYRVLVPALPVYDLPLDQSSVPGLTAYVRRFVERLDLGATVMAGNSLGGHVALLYALDFPDATSALVLSGASGIYEMSMGTSTLRRKDRDFIRERAELTFYDPKHATDELVDEMLELVNDRPRALRLIKMARSAEQETVTSRLSGLTMPTLLVWGQDDEITPPDVAYEFRDRLPNAELRFIDQCGHAPMIERPSAFDAFVIEFLETVDWPQVASTSEP
jgi:pimeloyl-ACP methyl ester carboxylesterase